MKLLEWMHRKLQQNHIKPFKDLTIGNYCTCLSAQQLHDEQDEYAKPNFSSRFEYRGSRKSEREYEEPFSTYTSKSEDIVEEENSVAASEIFHGFLAIGTLGSEAVVSEPATPTLTFYLDDITQKAAEATKDDLKLLSEELEKFLEAEFQDEECNGSSRNSYISNITLNEKQMGGVEYSVNENPVVCPLQGYLFGSSVGPPEPEKEMKNKKASLAELFQETKKADQTHKDIAKTREIKVNSTNKSSKDILKRIFKKVCASTKRFTPLAGSATESTADRKQYRKVLQMLHKKIHPENSPAATRETNKPKKYKIDNSPTNDCCYNQNSTYPEKDRKSFSQGTMAADGIMNNLKLHQFECDGNPLHESGEHWIKTDAEYLVLEL